jgi:putative PIN family toxin of toxin-antitoxin system
VTRAVVDPGVLVAALISPRSAAPGHIVRAWAEGEFELVISPALLGELRRVLLRPKFRRYVSEDAADAYVAALESSGVMVPDPPVQAGITPDPGDDYLVALLRATAADVLVSGDRHLAGLPRVESPAAFVRRLAA